jgi:alpha-L-rhamnosidase
MKEDWQAHWIWSSLPENTSNVYLEARKTFELPSCPEQASLFISANQEYLVYINGQEAGRGPSPSDQQWKYFDRYDVGPLLNPGCNVVAVLVYHFGSTDIVTQQMQGPGGLIAELEIDTGSARFSVFTDSGWKVRRSPRWIEQVSRQHQWNGFREIYRAEREDSWEQAAYDDSEWENATVIAKAGEPGCPWPRLLPRDSCAS